MSAVTERPAKIKVIREPAPAYSSGRKKSAEIKVPFTALAAADQSEAEAVGKFIKRHPAMWLESQLADLVKLLGQGINLVGDDDVSMLLIQASQVADELVPENPPAFMFYQLRSCAALIRAAQRVPDDPLSVETTKSLQEAQAILFAITGDARVLDGPATPALQKPRPPAAAHTWDQVIGDVMSRHEVVEALLLQYAEASGSLAVRGALTLVEALTARMAKVREDTADVNNHLAGVFPDLARDYRIAIDVAAAVNPGGLDDMLMWAAIYLLDDCQDIVDGHLNELAALANGSRA